MSKRYKNRRRVHYRERGRDRPFCGQPYIGPPLETTRTKAGVTCQRCRTKMANGGYSVSYSRKKSKKVYEDFQLPPPTEKQLARAQEIGDELRKKTYEEWARYARGLRRR